MTKLKYAVKAIVIVLFGVTVYAVYESNSALYDGPVSDHFDGTQFYGERPDHSFGDMIKWMWEMETVEWPEWIDDPPQPELVEYVSGDDLKVTYINHATMLLQMDSLNILTDPIWSDVAGPISWAGTPRVRKPGIDFEVLPPIDLVLISHDHYDHLDLPTLKRLDSLFHPQILVGLGTRKLLESEDLSRVAELDWWDEYNAPSIAVKVTFVPAQHGSGRGMWGGNRRLWGGYVIESTAGKVYFAGDTGYGQFVEEISEKFGDFRLTILPIGNYEARWFMKSQHMNPDDAVEAHRQLNSAQSVGMHYSTFMEHPEQTIGAHEIDLASALNANDLSESVFWVLGFGEGRLVPIVNR